MTDSDIMFEKELLVKNEVRLGRMNDKLGQRFKTLVPSELCYKMTNSEITAKARRLAKESKLRNKERI